MIRKSAVAGSFYEGHPDALRADVEGHLDADATKEPALGCVCPHAGYMYSGDVAGAAFSAIAIPETVIVLSFSHRGLGARYAVWPEGAWHTPLGDVPVNADLAAKIIDASPLLEADTDAFQFEHSGEVMLPFLQVLRPDVRIVMISVHPIAPLDELQAIAQSLATVLREEDPKPLLVASSDMTHHESAASAEKHDSPAIHAMTALDEVQLYDTVRENHISMCGVCPAVAVIACVKALGATEGRLVRYENSGKATGDTASVVAYAGLVFK